MVTNVDVTGAQGSYEDTALAKDKERAMGELPEGKGPFELDPATKS
jgi:hypothetical protein